MNSAAAEMATKAKTPQPSWQSNSVVSSGGVPGGPGHVGGRHGQA